MYTIDNKGCLISYDGDITDGTLTIPDEAISIGQMCFESRDDIEKVVIPEGVKVIEKSAFEDCTSLEEVTLPDSLREIRSFAFAGCTLLKKIRIHENLQLLGYGAFYSCPNLEELDLPYTIPYIEGMPFEGTQWVFDQSSNFITICEKKQLIKCMLPPDTTDIDIPEGIRVIEGACFDGLDKIRHINLPASVESVSSFAWYSLSNLEEITVSPDNEYYASKDGVLFNKDMTELIAYPCKRGGTFYAVPGGVKIIHDQAFAEASLEKLVLSRSVEELGMECFCYMPNIKRLYITERIHSIGEGAFEDCRSLSEIKVSPRNKHFIDCGGVLFTKDKKTLMFIPNGSGHTHYSVPEGVSKLAECALNGHQTIKTVSLPKSLKEIGTRAFSDCAVLESLDIPDSVTKIGSLAFAYAEQLKTLRLPKKIKELSNGELENCERLEKVYFPKSVESIGRFLFNRCSSIREVYLGQLRLISNNYGFLDLDIKSVKRLHRRGDCIDDVQQGICACVMADAYLCHGREFAHDYIKRYAEDVFEYFINYAQTQLVKQLTDSGEFLTAENIGRICEIAVEHTQQTGDPEIQVYLTQYRHTHFGGLFDELTL